MLKFNSWHIEYIMRKVIIVKHMQSFYLHVQEILLKLLIVISVKSLNTRIFKNSKKIAIPKVTKSFQLCDIFREHFIVSKIRFT